jgi:TonB-dependent receptor
MRRTRYLLSVATLPLLFAAAAAEAQIAQGGSDQTQEADAAAGAEAQDDASPAAPEDAQANAGESITVTGLRQSLRTAQAIKRDSDSILDAIVAEDIGKLPDNTAAESIARIAGVQVTRYSDEANGILIRGLPDVATSYNGREIFTAELRRVQLQDFPSQALAGIEVYKSGTADIIEPGLAGLVNVRTRRPFDFKDQVIAGGLRGTYNDQSKKFDPSGNVLFSDRWDAGDGEVGFLANVTYAQSQYYNGVRYNATWIRDSYWSDVGTQGTNARNTPSVGVFRFPNNIGLYNDGGKRFRPSGNFAFQWAPSNNFETYVEGLYQGYRGRGYADNFDVPLEWWGPSSTPPVFTNVVLLEGTDQAQSLTKTSGAEPQGYRSTTQDYTNTYQIAAGAKWETGRAVISTDFAYTWSRYHRENYSLDFRTVGARTVDVEFDRDGAVFFEFPNWDGLDPDNYIFRGYYEALYDVSGKGWQWRTDLKLDTDWDFLPLLQFGVRATDRDGNMNSNGSRYADVSVANIPYGSLPIGELVPTINPFRGGYSGFSQYLTTPRNGIYDNREALRQFTYDALAGLIAGYPGNGISTGDYNYFRERLPEYATDDIQLPVTSNWRSKEKTFAAYAQAKYKFDLGGLTVDGVAGVRAVMTDGASTGVSTLCLRNNPNDETDSTCTIQYTPRTEKQNYLDLLPNVSMRVRFTPKLQLRLGFTETRTKANFGDLIPGLNVRPVVYNDNNPRRPGLFNPDYVGNSGNPQLRPFTSTNFDASLEWYFSSTGFVSIAGFHRDIFGFTTYVPLDSIDPVLGKLRVVQPINAADANIKGLELNAQTFLDFLPSPWNGFGVSGNVTYLKGKNRVPSPNDYDPETGTFSDPGEYQKIPGLSKWTYNLAAFYEKSGLSARVSYNFRSDWVNGYGFDEVAGSYTGNGTRARDRLDASVSYDITKSLTIGADISNILAKPFRNFVGYAPDRTYPIDLRDEGRYFGFNLRFRFGE